MLRKVIASLFFIALLSAGAASAFVWQWLHQPSGNPAFEYTVANGASFTAVASALHHKSIIRYPRLWRAYAQRQDLASRVKAGEYSLAANLSPVKILQQLVDGEVILRRFTIVEGSTYKQLQEKLASAEHLKMVAESFQAARFKSSLKLEQYASLEGLFFADTYAFARGMSVQALLDLASQRLQNVLQEEWQQRADGLPYETPYEALIMASIIEKETAVAQERPQISGVFVRRLLKGMRLQTDPTVIYGMGDDYKGNLRSRDLREETPYNTYRIKGLPPTPIAMVGREAIHAALNPSDETSLYFVAKGDGTHAFSATLDEHNKAVRQYQLNQRRQDYRSTPKGNR